MNQTAIRKRDGSLNLGDTPLYFRNCVVIEGEVFWQIKWSPTLSALQSAQMKEQYGANAPVGFMLYDSFESEEALKKWNLSQFNMLKEQVMNKLNAECSD